MIPFVDTHCHIDTYEEHAKESFASLWERLDTKPEAMVHVACDPEDFEYAKNICEKHSFFYAAYGVHPSCANTFNNEIEKQLRQYLSLPKTVACGEIGLDYHYEGPSREMQKNIFDRQLRLGLEMGKPLVLHLREADADSLSILRKARLSGAKLHVHCYTGSPEFAMELLELPAEVFIGFTGIITFKNAQNVRDAAKIVPIHRLLLETDAPYLAPVPYRGKPAHSGMIPIIAEHLAAIKEVSLENLMRACRENTRLCYGI